MAEALDSSHIASNALERITGCTLVKTQSYVDGAWVGAVGGVTSPVYNPVTNAHLTDVTNLGHAETLRAIDVTDVARPARRELADEEHAGLMRRWSDLLIANTDDLATLITVRQGKPLTEIKGEIIYSASFTGRFAEEAKRVSDDVMTSTWRDKRMAVLKQPVGVCAPITPWGFPLVMITREVTSAMATGCTIVTRPVEQTPLSMLAMTELTHRADIPEDVVSVVMGDVDRSIAIGKALCGSPIVHHLSFTGSMPAGRILMQQCSPMVRKVALELDDHASLIVFDDADIDATAEGAVQSKYRNADQTCVCMNRFYVHASVHDAFVEESFAKARDIKVGNGFELSAAQGSLVDDQAVEKVQRHIDDAVQKDVRLTTDGKLMWGFDSQRFVEPTVLADTTPDILIACEEVFDPVFVILKFQDEAEVMRLVNDTEFGLVPHFFSCDIGRTWRVAEQLEYGMIGINTGLISNEVAPFGGTKQSGLSREGSVCGIDEYLELKYLCMGGI